MLKLFIVAKILSYLKLEQIYFRLYYSVRSKVRSFFNYKPLFNLYRKGNKLVLNEFIAAPKCYDTNKFTLLNKSIRFSDRIDWEYMDNGKLWINHLNYFDYLLQEDVSRERGMALIYLMIDHLPKSTVALKPYSISLRGINWIKFLSKHGITRKTIDRYLYCQYRILMDNIAYDKLGNHVLENGFSMLYGAYYFKGYELFNEAKILLTKELYEQILPDGGHYQLSPMYHQLILNRVLDSINLMKNNVVFQDEQLLQLLKSIAAKMLGWLEQMTYENGEIPCLNDSTYEVVPTTAELIAYADRLNITSTVVELKESGYRRFVRPNMEGVLDVGNVGPDYQTDHAHSDTFNFELRYDGKPFIVDTGTSTYESVVKRKRERSTISHNTVRVGNIEQTEVYGRFRVGRRAKVVDLTEGDDVITAVHDGYKHIGILHERTFSIGKQNLYIKDQLIHDLDELQNASAFLHFAPGCKVKEVSDKCVFVNDKKVEFSGHNDIKVLDYDYCLGFNKTEKAKMLQVSFVDHLETLISKTEG